MKNTTANLTKYEKLPEGWLISSMGTKIDGINYWHIHENKSLFTPEGRQSGLLIK